MSRAAAALRDLAEAAAALCDIGRLFYERGWAVGTSGNYSVVTQREPLRLLMTATGRDKRALAADDLTVVDGDGRTVAPDAPRPSAETLLHVALAQAAGAGAVLHTHSIWGTLLSDACFERGGVEIAGYEMLKGLSGIETHETCVVIDIFENSQGIAALARQARERLGDPTRPLRHGFLIRNHGLYAWGRDLGEARRHVEILEFLFEVLGRKRGWPADASR